MWYNDDNLRLFPYISLLLKIIYNNAILHSIIEEENKATRVLRIMKVVTYRYQKHTAQNQTSTPTSRQIQIRLLTIRDTQSPCVLIVTMHNGLAALHLAPIVVIFRFPRFFQRIKQTNCARNCNILAIGQELSLAVYLAKPFNWSKGIIHRLIDAST